MTGLDVDLQLGVLAGCVYVETTVHCHERIVAANTACIGPLASLTEETRNAVLSISSQMQLALAARTVARARRVLLAMPDVRPEHRHHRHRHGRS